MSGTDPDEGGVHFGGNRPVVGNWRFDTLGQSDNRMVKTFAHDLEDVAGPVVLAPN